MKMDDKKKEIQRKNLINAIWNLRDMFELYDENDNIITLDMLEKWDNAKLIAYLELIIEDIENEIK